MNIKSASRSNVRNKVNAPLRRRGMLLSYFEPDISNCIATVLADRAKKLSFEVLSLTGGMYKKYRYVRVVP